MGKKKDDIISNYIQIFIDTGDGYIENDSIRLPAQFGDHEYTFDLKSFSSINFIRFDPLDNYAIIDLIDVKGINSETGDEAALNLHEQNGSALNTNEKDPPRFIFDHKDSQLIFEAPENKIDKIVLRMILADPYETLDILLNQEIADKKEQLEKLSHQKKNIETKLLKHINGKINLQSAEIEYLKTMIQSGFIKLRNTGNNKTEENDEFFQHIKAELNNEKENKEKVKARLQDIETQIAKKNIYLSKLESEYKRNNSDLEALMVKNEKSETDNKNKFALIESQKVNLKNLSDEIKLLKRTIKSLEKKNGNNNIKIGSLNSTIKSLKLELRKEKRQSIKLNFEFDTLKDNFAKQTEEVESLNTKASDLDQFTTELNTIIEFLE